MEGSQSSGVWQTEAMVDSHDGLVKPIHRATFTYRDGMTTDVAVPVRSTMERWLGKSHPVLSLCEIHYSEPLPRISRTDLRTISGVDLKRLYETGRLQLGKTSVELWRSA